MMKNINNNILEHPLGINEIMEVLPHRPPFLLIDKITSVSNDLNEIEGIKAITYNEYFFLGHFPKYPIVPGVLIVEALAQLGAFLILKFHENITYKNADIALSNIENFKFKNKVLPGEIIKLYARFVKTKMNFYKIYTKASVENKEIASGYVIAMLKKINQ